MVRIREDTGGGGLDRVGELENETIAQTWFRPVKFTASQSLASIFYEGGPVSSCRNCEHGDDRSQTTTSYWVN